MRPAYIYVYTHRMREWARERERNPLRPSRKSHRPTARWGMHVYNALAESPFFARECERYIVEDCVYLLVEHKFAREM